MKTLLAGLKSFFSRGTLESTRAFFQWYLFAAIHVLAFCTAIYYGAIKLLFTNDITHLSPALLVFWFGAAIWIGKITWSGKPTEYQTKLGWYLAEILMGLGLLGTLFGFTYALSSQFDKVSLTDTVQIKETASRMSAGLAAALYTTIVGLMGSLSTVVQMLNLEWLKDKTEKKNE